MEFEMQVASSDLKTAAKIHDDESLDLTFRDLSFTTGKGKPFSCASLCYSILNAANSTPLLTMQRKCILPLGFCYVCAAATPNRIRFFVM